MKKFILQTLLGSLYLSVNAEQTFLTASDSSFEPKVNRFGNKETLLKQSASDGITHKFIELQDNTHYYFDYKQQAAHLE